MILTDDQIRAAVRKGEIVIDPFDDGQVQAATYDFRVGRFGATTSTKKKVNLEDAGYLLLAPGDFGVVETLERIELSPQHAARFGLRSRYARKGLIATTGPQIDPGFRGRLILGLTNLTPKPVSIPYKDDVISIEFHRLEHPVAKPYEGPYQDRDSLGAEDIEFITETEGMALSEMLTTLRSLNQVVGTLAERVKTLLWAIPVIVAIGIGVIGVVVAIK